MYKKIFCLLLFCSTITGLKSQNQQKSSNIQRNPDALFAAEKAFKIGADTIQTGVYWYWLSGNVSKEGVIKDLEAMKKVGINRAFIGDIGLNDVPYGKVKFLSPEWWEIMHTALKTATRLNIQIGLFNGPGWSQAGGPWVKPAQAMRYLTSSEIMVRGPRTITEKLIKPQANFQDVKVLAYPVADDYNSNFPNLRMMITSPDHIDSLQNLTDGIEATGIHFKRGERFSLSFKTGAPLTLRSLTLSTLHRAVYFEGDIQVKKGNEYVSIRHFSIDRRAPALNFGFSPWAKSVIAIPANTSNDFRIEFSNVSNDSGIAELSLSSTAKLDQYSEKTLAKAWQTEDLTWDAYLWNENEPENSAYNIDPSKVLDISAFMQVDGTLNWKVPSGNWVIERTGMSTTNTHNVPATPEATGLETDKLSKEHIKSHFNAYIGQVLQRIPAEDRKTLKIVVADSYETGSQNWTDLLLQEFQEKFKYSAIPYIPVLQGKVVGNTKLSDRFLWDLRRLIADDAAYKYVGGLREISHRFGLTTWLENYGYFGFPGEFLQYGGQSDEVAGEFWLDGRLGTLENKAASSAAHIYGKTKVSAESFTSAGAAWRAYPAMIKARGDRFFTDGVNNTILHVYIHQPETVPKPGLSAWFGTEFNRGNTWFLDGDLFIKYLKRCNLMLQQGRYVADAAYFIGEDAPRLMGVKDPELPKGYSFDYINAEVIMNRLSVQGGQLFLPNGIKYSILVLPKLETIRPELLAKIKELVSNGAVVLGPRPNRSPSLQNYPEADRQVKAMAEELWGKADGVKVRINHYGKGMVLSGMTMEEAFKLLEVLPDLKTAQKDPILFIHRELPGASIYFLSNQKSERVSFKAVFRTSGKLPELWDATNGTVRYLPDFRQIRKTTTVPMQLEANGSAFIIFRKDGKAGEKKSSNYPSAISVINFVGSWTAIFNAKFGGPKNPVLFNELTDWSQSSNDSIRHYSGTAFYRNRFELKSPQKNRRYILDLGLVKNIAKVMVNGKDVGGVWTPPYRLDITQALKPGNNEIKIKIVNSWVNRLLGDSQLPVNQRKTAALFGPDPKGGLESSGLLGPVKIDILNSEDL